MTKEELIRIAKGPVTEKQLEDYRIWRVKMEKEFAETQRMHNSHSNWQAEQ